VSQQEHKAVFTANNKDLNRKIEQSGNKMQQLSAKVKTLFVGFAALFSVRLITKFIGESVKLYDVQAKAEKSLLIALKGRKDIQQSLIEQAGELQKKTLYGDEESIKAASRLAMVIGDNEDALKRLMPLVQDFATGKNMDLAASADLIAKSVGSSTNALTRYGITIEGEVGSTKRLESAIKGLNNQVGGQAEAAAKVGLGAMTQLGNAFGDLREEMGRAITNANLFQEAIRNVKTVIEETTDRIKDETTIQESGISKWDKLIFRFAKFSKVGRQAIGDMADSIRKQEELNTTVEDGTDTEEIHIDTIADYRVQIKDLTDELETLTAGEGKRAEQIRQQIADTQKLIDETLNYKTALEEIAGPSLTSEFTFIGKMLTEDVDFSKEEQAIDESLSNIELAYTNAQLAAAAFGKEVMASSASGANSLLDFARVAVQTAKKIISAYLAEGIAAQVKSALEEVPFPFGLIAAGVAGGGAAALFNSLVPDFAAGGAAYGPTLALVGEAPGISRSNPEYIGTAAQLSQMGIGGGTLRTEIKRDKMIFWLEEGKALSERSY